jgi:hypothetical protein
MTRSRLSSPGRAATTLAIACLFFACTPEEVEQVVRTPVPPDLGLEVVNAERPEALRCSLDVRIAYKVPGDVLASATEDLAEEEGLDDCERLFVALYLPYMQIGGGAWAVVELVPEPAVSILGLGASEERELVAESRKARDTVATWVDDSSYAAVITVFKEGQRVVAERLFGNGEVRQEEVVFSRYRGRTGFEERDGNALGRHYVAGEGGNLETHDAFGRVSVARLAKLDRDLDRLIVDAREVAREKVVRAAAREERVRVAAGAQRLERWEGWLTLYQGSLEPLRQPLMRLAESVSGADYAPRCQELVTGLSTVPPEVRMAPSPALDVSRLNEAIARTALACADDRPIQVLIEARSTLAFWRETDRVVDQIAVQYRRLGDEDSAATP